MKKGQMRSVRNFMTWTVIMMISSILIGCGGGDKVTANASSGKEKGGNPKSLLCEKMLSEKDLRSLFKVDVSYASSEATNMSNTLSCEFTSPESDEISEIFTGHINVYCDHDAHQITPLKSFETTEGLIKNGESEFNGGSLIFGDAQVLTEVGSKAYFYTTSMKSEVKGKTTESPKQYIVAFMHGSKDCYIEIGAGFFSGKDIKQQIIEAAQKIDSNL